MYLVAPVSRSGSAQGARRDVASGSSRMHVVLVCLSECHAKVHAGTALRRRARWQGLAGVCATTPPPPPPPPPSGLGRLKSSLGIPDGSQGIVCLFASPVLNHRRPARPPSLDAHDDDQPRWCGGDLDCGPGILERGVHPCIPTLDWGPDRLHGAWCMVHGAWCMMQARHRSS